MTVSWTNLVGKAQRFRNAHWPRYIFIHINKTAGSSIERALNLRFEHKTAAEKRYDLGQFRWSRAFTFAFVRNPWDKVVSHYNYRVGTNQTGMGDKHISFHDWVLRTYGEHDPRYYDQPRMFMPQHLWLQDDDGRIIVDFVGRFERLKDDFDVICRKINVTGHLPHLKPTLRPEYREFYDADTRECVYCSFEADLATFGYVF